MLKLLLGAIGCDPALACEGQHLAWKILGSSLRRILASSLEDLERFDV